MYYNVYDCSAMKRFTLFNIVQLSPAKERAAYVHSSASTHVCIIFPCDYVIMQRVYQCIWVQAEFLSDIMC